MSASEEYDLSRQLEELTGQIKAVGAVLADSTNGRGKDGGRAAEANDAIAALSRKASELDERITQTMASDEKARRDAETKAQIEEAVKAALSSHRAPSLSATLGQGSTSAGSGRGRLIASAVPASPVLKALFSDYQASELFNGILGYKGMLTDGIDVEIINAAKASLDDLGVLHDGAASLSKGMLGGAAGFGKATLATSGSTGGYVLPNNLVDTVVKPATQAAVYQQLVTVINGVSVRGVDQPFRLNRPTRATFQDWGTTKTNVNETYGSYTANLGTLGVIYDVGKQYLRFSTGAAETDVMDEITKAMILGENFYMIAGANQSPTVGSGDQTYGVYTALNASSSFNNYTTAFTPSATTLAGSSATAFATALGALGSRSQEATAIVCDVAQFWTIASQGTDTAGFFYSPTGGPSAIRPYGGLSFWGVPVYHDANLGTNAASKIAIVADWKVFKLYRGLEFRIDTSDQANTRWDQNLVGFRGEEEIGFNAGTGVNVGAAQLITGLTV